jgi:hypothetical protein
MPEAITAKPQFVSIKHPYSGSSLVQHDVRQAGDGAVSHEDLEVPLSGRLSKPLLWPRTGLEIET